MKTTITGLSSLSVLVALVLGCSWAGSSDSKPTNTSRAGANVNANKSLSDTVIDTAVGEKTLGIPECDEVFKILTDYANNPDDNFAVRAGKAVIVNQVKESLRTTIEENQADKKQLAEACREAKVQFASQTGSNSNKAK
jgi:uncharacterized C2H2 Zn-finger protein